MTMLGEFMGFIVDGAKRMRRLIDDLLSYSRLGRDRVQMGTHSLDHALDAALGNLGLILEDTGAVIDRRCPLPTLRCEPHCDDPGVPESCRQRAEVPA